MHKMFEASVSCAHDIRIVSQMNKKQWRNFCIRLNEKQNVSKYKLSQATKNMLYLIISMINKQTLQRVYNLSVNPESPAL